MLPKSPPFLTAFLVLATLAILPLWVVTLPPMVDLPQHAAQTYALLHISQYNSIYEIQWFTPYMGFLLLSAVLSLPFGVLIGTKLAVTLIILGLPFALLTLLKEVEGNPWLCLLGFPFSYGFALYWGFTTYMLAIPLSILFVAATLKQTKNPTNKNNTTACLLGLALFFSHPIPFGISMLIAYTLIFNETLEKKIKEPSRFLKEALLLAKPYLPASFLTISWLLVKPREGNFPTVWAKDSTEWFGRVTDFFTWSLSGDFGNQQLQYEGLITALLCLTVLTYFQIQNTQKRRLIPFTIATAIFLLSPNEIAGLDSLVPRQSLLILCFFLAIFPANTPKSKWVEISRNLTLVGLCSTALTLPLEYFLDFKKKSDSMFELIQTIPPNKTVVKLQNEYETWNTLHILTWYQALKGGQTLKEFTWLHHMPIRRTQNRKARMDLVHWWKNPNIDYFVYFEPQHCIEAHNIENLEKERINPLRLQPLHTINQWTLATEFPYHPPRNLPNPIPNLLKKNLDQKTRKVEIQKGK